MKAIVHYEYGSPDVLRYAEIERPVPGDGQVLIRVRAASLNTLDRRLIKTKAPSFLRKKLGIPKKLSIAQPARMGRDVAGQVEAVGDNVTQFKPGDEVFGICPGSFAEYACANESKLVMKPHNVSFEEAACAPLVAFTALQGLRRGLIKPGQKVLINGAAGGVGTFAVQIAKSFGAEVTGVCSTRSMDTVRSIGADHVIDYTQQDFTETGHRYDLVYDLVWQHSWSASRRILTPNGRYVMAGGAANARVIAFLAREVLAIALSSFSNRKFLMLMAKSDKEDLALIRDLMADGKVKPVIDKSFRLSQVPDAVRYAEEGHARGKVVISVE